MSKDKDFVDAILDHPAEIAPKLVYADWLEEHGNGVFAERLRLMAEIQENPNDMGAARRYALWLADHGELPAAHYVFNRAAFLKTEDDEHKKRFHESLRPFHARSNVQYQCIADEDFRVMQERRKRLSDGTGFDINPVYHQYISDYRFAIDGAHSSSTKARNDISFRALRHNFLREQWEGTLPYPYLSGASFDLDVSDETVWKRGGRDECIPASFLPDILDFCYESAVTRLKLDFRGGAPDAEWVVETLKEHPVWKNMQRLKLLSFDFAAAQVFLEKMPSQDLLRYLQFRPFDNGVDTVHIESNIYYKFMDDLYEHFPNLEDVDLRCHPCLDQQPYHLAEQKRVANFQRFQARQEAREAICDAAELHSPLPEVG